MGNIGSVAKKIKKIGYHPYIATEVNHVLNASKLILPGVGHFARGVENLKKNGLWEAIQEAVLHRKTPILGICLGMQLMAKHSEEGNCEGLGWIDAEVCRFEVSDSIKYKVPHMGWNNVNIEKESVLFNGISKSDEFYFVHSYHFNCHQKQEVLSTTTYDYTFVSAIEKNNIYGVQFHPEKSHEAGEMLLRNFLAI